MRGAGVLAVAAEGTNHGGEDGLDDGLRRRISLSGRLRRGGSASYAVDVGAVLETFIDGSIDDSGTVLARIAIVDFVGGFVCRAACRDSYGIMYKPSMVLRWNLLNWSHTCLAGRRSSCSRKAACSAELRARRRGRGRAPTMK